MCIRDREETSALLVRRRLSDSNQPASLVNPAADFRHQFLVIPLFPSGKSGSCVACIDDHVHIGRDAVFPHIVKTQKGNIHTGAA